MFRLFGAFMAIWFAWRYRLPRKTNPIRIHRDIVIRAYDGVELLTDHFEPTSPGPHPTAPPPASAGRSPAPTPRAASMS